MNKVTILGNTFEVLDALNNITLADSFLKNKTGTGNGEAKLYLGNVSEKLFDFFEEFTIDLNGFFLQKDLLKMLNDLENEYKSPQNQYYTTKTINGIKQSVNVTNDLKEKWGELINKLKKKSPILNFSFYRSQIKPPRVYINSESDSYTLLRHIGIPTISYISVLKLKDEKNNIMYYFKPFVSYSNEIDGYNYLSSIEKKELKEIESSNKSEKQILSLKTSRIGQGKYKEKLLNDMPYCPFTMINDERLLRASHIKPWVVSNDKEKLDPKNGLTLSPTYDVLFDRGFISFQDNGNLMVSPFISPMNQKRLNITNGKNIGINKFFDSSRIAYLKYHRDNIFQGI
ncbi:HNH endonuclease [Staphylococcus hominis]|uniref:HNH endonuclease n=1 Tax=Staphylococcus hominis TaxID=1290 RepID=UPI0034D4618D